MVRGWKPEEKLIKKLKKWLARKEKNQESRSQAKEVFQEGRAAAKSAI